jgi:hypothetical protein
MIARLTMKCPYGESRRKRADRDPDSTGTPLSATPLHLAKTRPRGGWASRGRSAKPASRAPSLLAAHLGLLATGRRDSIWGINLPSRQM